jgi:Flp pilus assembly protein TadD
MKLIRPVILVVLGGLTGCQALPLQPAGGLLDRGKSIETNMAMARSLEREGNYGKARDAYQEVLAQDPYNAAVHHRLGVIAVKQGLLDEGMASLERARLANPNDPDLLTDIGYTLYLQNRLSEAARVLQDAAKADPGNKRTMNNLALVMGKEGRMQEAQSMFRQVGNDAQMHANLAFIYAQRGEFEQAERHYSRALDYDSDMQVAARGLLELAQRRMSADPEPTPDAASVAASPAAATPVAAKPVRSSSSSLASIQDSAASGSRLSRQERDEIVQELRAVLDAKRDAVPAEQSLADAQPAARGNASKKFGGSPAAALHFSDDDDSATATIELTGAITQE